MKKFTLKTKHLKLNHIINLGLMRHWMDFLLHFYRLNICLRVSLFSLSQKLSYSGLAIIIWGHWTKRSFEEKDHWEIILTHESLSWTRKNFPAEAARETIYGLTARFFKKKLVPTLLLWGKWPSTSCRDSKYQWVTDLFKAQNTVTEMEENSCTSIFTQQASINVAQKNKGIHTTSSTHCVILKIGSYNLKSLFQKQCWG